MKVAITRVRNEEVILKSTLDRLSYHFDSVIAFDDCSTDGTRDILSEHKLVEYVP
jgi:glycosyltransferase involved in cell wall biosynthesis